MRAGGARLRVVAAVVVVIGLGAAGWAAFAALPDDAREVRYLVPPGAADRLRAGEALALLPPTIQLTVGVRDILVITNDDTAIHQIGPIILGPRQTYRIPFRRPGRFQFACSLHPAGRLAIVVASEPTAGLARLRWRIGTLLGSA